MQVRMIPYLVAMIASLFILNQAVADDEASETGLPYLIEVGHRVDPQSDGLGPQMYRIELALDDKTVVAQYGGGEYYVIATFDTSGELATFTEDDYELIDETMEEMTEASEDREMDPLQQIVFNALNFLDSWPKGLPVLIRQTSVTHIAALRDGKAVVMSTADVRSRSEEGAIIIDMTELDDTIFTLPEIEVGYGFDRNDTMQNRATAASWSSICYKMGQNHKGKYIRKINWFRYKYRDFWKVVGSSSCFGRCGAGCGSGQRYTQDCFNHDGCVDAQGMLHPRCDIMFGWCVDDFFSAPQCR